MKAGIDTREPMKGITVTPAGFTRGTPGEMEEAMGAVPRCLKEYRTQ